MLKFRVLIVCRIISFDFNHSEEGQDTYLQNVEKNILFYKM